METVDSCLVAIRIKMVNMSGNGTIKDGVMKSTSPGLTTEISAIVAKYVRLDCNRAWYLLTSSY